jgi:hypothetical protein
MFTYSIKNLGTYITGYSTAPWNCSPKKQNDLTTIFREGDQWKPSSAEMYCFNKKIRGKCASILHTLWQGSKKGLGWALGFLSGAPVPFTMVRLVFMSVATMAGLENATFQKAWNYFTAKQRYDLLVISLVGSLLAIGGQAPFNVHSMKEYTYGLFDKIADGKNLCKREHNILWTFLRYFETIMLDPFKIICAGDPLGNFIWTALGDVCYVPDGYGFKKVAAIITTLICGNSISSVNDMLANNEIIRMYVAGREFIDWFFNLFNSKCFKNTPTFFQQVKKNQQIHPYIIKNSCGKKRVITTREMRFRLLHLIYNAMDVAQLLPAYVVGKIKSKGKSLKDKAEFLVKLNKESISLFKKIIAHIILPILSIPVIYYGTPQFYAIGALEAETEFRWLGISLPQWLADVLGGISQFMFAALWFLALKDLYKTIARLFPNEFSWDHFKRFIDSNCTKGSWKYYFAFGVAIACGICLAITNIGIMPIEFSATFIFASICAVGANTAVSLFGIMFGLKAMGVLKFDPFDYLNFDLTDMKNFVGNASDQTVKEFYQKVMEYFAKNGMCVISEVKDIDVFDNEMIDNWKKLSELQEKYKKENEEHEKADLIEVDPKLAKEYTENSPLIGDKKEKKKKEKKKQFDSKVTLFKPEDEDVEEKDTSIEQKNKLNK